jgi:hypothetical protein
MARNGAGTYVLPAGQPVVTGTTISSATHNTLANDLANAITTSIATDGQSVVTANIPFAGYKLTGLGAPTVNGDALRYENLATLVTSASIQDQTYTAFTTGGTSTAYTLTPTPAITAYTAGQSFWVTFNAASGAAPTLTISGVATPPNLVRLAADGSYVNVGPGEIPLNHQGRVTLLSTTQAVVELPASPRATRIDVATVAGAVDLTTAAPNTDDIRFTGTLTPTSFTVAVGRVFRAVSQDAFTLPNNASIVTNTGANLAVKANSSFELRVTAANVVEVLNYTDPAVNAKFLLLPSVASAGQTSISFSSIPAWAKKITPLFAGLSLSGTASFLVRVGTGSATTTGYISGSFQQDADSTSTAGFIMRGGIASDGLHGSMQLSLANEASHVWVSSHSANRSGGVSIAGGGSIGLGSLLDIVVITSTNGTDTIDSGLVGLLVEGYE